MAFPIIPEDAFQDHFHDGSRKVEFLFQMLGVCFCAMALNKLIAVFTTPESTFLRQNSSSPMDYVIWPWPSSSSSTRACRCP